MAFVRHDFYWEMLFVRKPLFSGDRAPGGGHWGGKGLEAEACLCEKQQEDPNGLNYQKEPKWDRPITYNSGKDGNIDAA